MQGLVVSNHCLERFAQRAAHLHEPGVPVHESLNRALREMRVVSRPPRWLGDRSRADMWLIAPGGVCLPVVRDEQRGALVVTTVLTRQMARKQQRARRARARRNQRQQTRGGRRPSSDQRPADV